MKFNDYDWAVDHLAAIYDFYNMQHLPTGKFLNTKKATCRMFNITTSTFKRLMYNFPSKFKAHYNNRKSNGKVWYNNLNIDEINEIVTEYKERKLQNKEIIKKHNLAYQTFYKIIKIHIKKNEQKVPSVRYDENGLRICNVCNRAYKNEDLIKDNSQKTGYRSICKTCFNKRVKLRREKKNDIGSNKQD